MKKLMIPFVLVASLMSPHFSFSAEPVELMITKDSTTGGPTFFLQYSPANSIILGSVMWSGKQLLQGAVLNSLMMAIYDTQSKARITSWYKYEDGPLGAHYDGDMGATLSFDSEIASIYKNLKTLRILFSVNQSVQSNGEFPITHFIEISAVCNSNPALFLNIDSGVTGCP